MSRYSRDIVSALEKIYEENPNPPRWKRLELAKKHGLSKKQVYKWFWERRFHGPRKQMSLTNAQRSGLLEAWHQYGPLPSGRVRAELARRLVMPLKRVTGWFNYRRHRKNENLPQETGENDKDGEMEENVQCVPSEITSRLHNENNDLIRSIASSSSSNNNNNHHHNDQNGRSLVASSSSQQEQLQEQVVEGKRVDQSDKSEDVDVSVDVEEGGTIDGVFLLGSKSAKFTSRELLRQVNQSVSDTLVGFLHKTITDNRSLVDVVQSCLNRHQALLENLSMEIAKLQEKVDSIQPN